MSWRAAGCLLVAVAFLAGCGSGSSEGEKANAPAALTVRAFYAAANRSAGPEACALLTPRTDVDVDAQLQGKSGGT